MTVFACLLQSASITAADLAFVVEACLAQLTEDFAPAHERMPPAVVIGDPPAIAGVRTVISRFRDSQPDDPDGALAYHWVDPASGLPVIDVLVDTILSQPGANLDSIIQAAGHEFIETDGDDFANDWSDRGDGTEEPRELVDRVQGSSYPKAVKLADGSTRTAQVTNFLLPAAFDDDAAPGTKFDFLGHLSSAREIEPNSGYCVTRPVGGGETTVFGNKRSAVAYSHKTLERHGINLTKLLASL